MKSPKEDNKIRISVASDYGTREDLLSTHLSLLFYTYLSCMGNLKSLFWGNIIYFRAFSKYIKRFFNLRVIFCWAQNFLILDRAENFEVGCIYKTFGENN